MFKPDEIVEKAKKRERQNLRFRTWLKNHADAEELDARFKAFHEKLFADYDCTQCWNCCRMYRTTVQPSEMEKIAECLGITVFELNEQYLLHEEDYYAFPAPCPMLQEDGKCRINDVKPEECCGFPYTDKPDRYWSLYGMMEYAGICPVVYEIIERLKQIYRFR